MSYGRRSRYHRAKENGKRVKGSGNKIQNIGGEIPGGCLYSPEWKVCLFEPAIWGDIRVWPDELLGADPVKTIISEEYQSLQPKMYVPG